MRTIVDLPGNQVRGLAALCRREKISRAEAVRRAVGKLLDEQKPSEDGLVAAFGLWQGRKLNVRRHVDQLRDEWS